MNVSPESPILSTHRRFCDMDLRLVVVAIVVTGILIACGVLHWVWS
jgi:hypothetical protein